MTLYFILQNEYVLSLVTAEQQNVCTHSIDGSKIRVN